MIFGDDGNLAVALSLGLFLLASTVLVFYWAATIDNDIENNPDK